MCAAISETGNPRAKLLARCQNAVIFRQNRKSAYCQPVTNRNPNKDFRTQTSPICKRTPRVWPDETPKSISDDDDDNVLDWLIDWVRLNVPPTHYRSYGDGFLRVKWPNQQCQSTEGRYVQRIRLQSHQVHPTVLTLIQQLCSMKHKKTNTYNVLEKNTEYASAINHHTKERKKELRNNSRRRRRAFLSYDLAT